MSHTNEWATNFIHAVNRLLQNIRLHQFQIFYLNLASRIIHSILIPQSPSETAIH